MGIMKCLAQAVSAVGLLCTLLVAEGDPATVAIDFEETPSPDLTSITNVYRGASETIYAFLVVTQDVGEPASDVTYFDIGYKFTSRDGSVVNQGFHRSAHWQALPETEGAMPNDIAQLGAPLPAVLGYWELDLRRGVMSRCELQLTANPSNGSEAVRLVSGEGQVTDIEPEGLSQDITCHGLVNQTFFPPRRSERVDWPYVPGEIVAAFMPGVVETGQSFAVSLDNVMDPGLTKVIESYGITGIRRLYSSAVPNPGPLLVRSGGGVITPRDRWDVFVLRLDNQADVYEIVDALLGLPRCRYAEPDYLFIPAGSSVPNDTLCGWHIDRLSMPTAWDLERGSSAVRVAVIDYGVDYDVPDLGGGYGSGYKVAGGYDYYGGDIDPMPDPENTHGTKAASVLGALTNNDSLGIAGVAGGWGGLAGETGPLIYALRVGGADSLPVPLIAEAISDAYQVHGCGVISMSLLGPGYTEVNRAVYDANRCDVVQVYPMGNGDDFAPYYFPASMRADHWVIAVGGSNRHPESAGDTIPERRVSMSDGYSWGSSYGDASVNRRFARIDLLAPAVDIAAASTESTFVSFQMTSSAVPQVAGVAALMLSACPSLDRGDIEGLLQASCTDILTDPHTDRYGMPDSLPGYDAFSGWGRINGDSALMFVDYPGWVRSGWWEVGWAAMTGWNEDALRRYPHGVQTNFLGDGPLCGGNYGSHWFCVQAWVPYSLGGPIVHAWGEGVPYVPEGPNTGWAPAGDTWGHDNFQSPYCRVIPGTETADGCSLMTYIYEVWDWSTPDSTFLGWYPTSQNRVAWCLNTLHADDCASVPGAEDPVAGSRGTLLDLSASPDPTSGAVVISLRIAQQARVRAEVFDVRGRFLATILDSTLDPGTHNSEWDCRDASGTAVAPGVYLCRASAGGEHKSMKIVVVNGRGK